MAIKKFIPFGESPVDLLVKEFLSRKGIDPGELSGYTITRGVDDVGTITVSMLFDENTYTKEELASARERASSGAAQMQQYIVGENGPELVTPSLLCKCMDSECTNPHYVPPDEESE